MRNFISNSVTVRALFLLFGFIFSVTTYTTAQVINPTQVGLIENGSPISPNLTGATSVYTQGNFAYVVGSSDVLEIFDISLPGVPLLKGTLRNGEGGALILKPLGIVVSGDFAYICNGGGSSVEVVDVSNAAHPVHKTNVSNNAPRFLYLPQGIFLSGNYLYLPVYGSWCMEVLDISIPGAPVHKGVAFFDQRNPHAVFVKNNFAYMASDGEIEIIDVSFTNSPAPVIRKKINQGKAGTNFQIMQALTVVGNHLYAVDRAKRTLEVINVADPLTPVNIASIKVTDEPWSINAIGNALYIGYEGDNLDVFDITTPEAPLKKAGLKSDLFGLIKSINSSGNTAYVADQKTNSMIVLDVTSPLQPTVKANVTTKLGSGGALLNDPQSVFVSGNYAYVADRKGNGLEIIDVSNPSKPAHKSSLTNGTGANFKAPTSVYVSGNYAFVAGDGSLEIVDVTNPSLPVHKGTLNDGNGAPPFLLKSTSIVVSGGYAYIASSGRSALEIVDVSNPASPVHKSSVVDNTNLFGAQSVYLSSISAKNYAFIACASSNRITILDVTSVSTPNVVKTLVDGNGSTPYLNEPMSVFVVGNYAYVVSRGSKALEIIDVSIPASAKHKGFIRDAGSTVSPPFLNYPRSVYVTGNTAFVASGFDSNTSYPSGLEVIDVTDPAAPVHKAALLNLQQGALLDGPTSIFVAGNYAYIANSLQFTNLNVAYLYGPGITNFTPKSGPVGTAVTITGENFNTFLSASINGVAAPITSVSATALTITVPEGATIGEIILTREGEKTSSGSKFLVTPTPIAPGQITQTGFTANWSDVGAISYRADISDDNFKATLKNPLAVYVAGKYAYVVSDVSNALQIVDISNPDLPVIKGSLIDGQSGAPFLKGANAIVVSGNYAYVVSYSSNSLEIIDVSDPALPVHRGSLLDGRGTAPFLKNPRGIYVAGNYAYVTSYVSDVLGIIDVSNPALPVHAGSLADGGGSAPFLDGPWTVHVSGNYAYVASYSSDALEIIDISNPALPKHKGSITKSSAPALNGASGIFVSGNYAYIASYDANALEIVDISDPALPVHKGSLSDGNGSAPFLKNANAVFVSGNYAYVASIASNALEIIDVTNPLQPVHAGALVDGGGTAPFLKGAYGVFVFQSNAYVASSASNALEIVNVSNPSAAVHRSAVVDSFEKVVTANSYSFQGLTPGTAYQFRVRASDGATLSTYSNTINIITLPSTPTANSATQINQTGFTANWTISPGATSYILDVAYDNAFSNFVVGYANLSIPNPAAIAQTLSGLNAYTTCYYRVRSATSSGNSDFSNVIKVTTLDLVPPVISTAGIPNPSVITQGNTPILNIIITDNVSVDSAQIFYRGISKTAFTKMNLPGGGRDGGNYSITVQTNWYDSLGLEYFFKGIDQSGNTTTSPLTYIQLLTQAISLPALPSGTEQSDYRIVSFPYQLATDNKVTTIYSGVPWNDNTKAGLWWWNTTAQNGTGVYDQYGSPNTFQTIDPGKGYWAITSTSITPQLSNVSAPKYNRDNLFSMTLKPNWNEIGNPYPVAISWDDVIAHNQANNITAFSALTIYDGNGYKVATGDIVLKPFEGGFVKNLSSSDITIQIPFKGQTNTGGRIASINADISNEDWNIFLHISQDGRTNQLGGFGMHRLAQSGVDRYDNFNPPSFLGIPEVNFINAAYPSVAFSNDMVSSQENYTWTFTPNGKEGSVTQLTWNNELNTNSSKQLLLLDEEQLTVIDMNTVSRYDFVLTKSSRFRIFYGNDVNATTSRITASAPFPNPLLGEAKTTIHLALPESGSDYSISMQVYNAQGGVIGSLNKRLAPGIHPLEFTLPTSLSGGIYIYKLAVTNEKISSIHTGKIVKP